MVPVSNQYSIAILGEKLTIFVLTYAEIENLQQNENIHNVAQVLAVSVEK
jgi:hypothetical protein